jgi:hypothetical protein
MIASCKNGRTGEELVAAYFGVLFQNFNGKHDKTYKKPQPALRPTQALGNQQIYTKVVTNSGSLLLGEKVLQPNGFKLAKSSDRR